jgi:uncharacterized protein YheU (UPF0270 family)
MAPFKDLERIVYNDKDAHRTDYKSVRLVLYVLNANGHFVIGVDYGEPKFTKRVGIKDYGMDEDKAREEYERFKEGISKGKAYINWGRNFSEAVRVSFKRRK